MNQREKLIHSLAGICKEKRYSLVTSESCTGGGLSYYLTKSPICSSFLERGYVVYSITSKEDVLDITPYSLQIYGAVSKEVAIEMAEKALEKSKAQISIAITGIDEAAATEHNEENHGIVWVACAGIDKKTITKKLNIDGDREKFCEKVILESLKILVDFLQ